MQLRNNVGAHALLILLSVVIAFLGLVMIAQLTRSDVYGTDKSASSAGWLSAARSDEQNNLNQSPVKVLPASKLRSLLGPQALRPKRQDNIGMQWIEDRHLLGSEALNDVRNANEVGFVDSQAAYRF